MKVIIAGSRYLTGCDADKAVFEAVHASGFFDAMTEIVSGGANGVDVAGERWAHTCTDKPVKRFPANWSKHGKSAGPIRNREMAKYADALIAIPHPTQSSKGTENMILAMRLEGKPVYVHKIEA